MSTRLFEELLEALAGPEAYPHPVQGIEVIHTHISVVFLAGEFAYKIKKPLNLGFLDFTSLEKRRRACEDEVRLNRRLAPRVYRGVAPITRGAPGFRIDGEGTAVEYAVRMERLPPDRTFERLLERGELESCAVARLARLVARFHLKEEGSPDISAEARWSVVAGNARENFEQLAGAVEETISRELLDRLRALTELTLERHRDLMERRAGAGVARDTHGDLHLDHVYSLPREDADDELVIIDCIEFNTRFRYADPVSDIAFLVMDLEFHGRPDLARVAADAYFEERKDSEGRELLPYYASYRAIVRGKVEGFALRESEVPEEQKHRLRHQARAHFLLALRLLAPPPERPALLLVGGLPGSGKSRLCRLLESSAGMPRLDSDEVRKQEAGIGPDQSAASEWGTGIYTPEWNDRTYDALWERASGELLRGRRVAVEASFREDARRRAFVERARSLAVPVFFLECQADDAEIHRRLAARSGDVSDAGISVYEAAKRRWEKPGPTVAPHHHLVSTAGSVEDGVRVVMNLLRRNGLA